MIIWNIIKIPFSFIYHFVLKSLAKYILRAELTQLYDSKNKVYLMLREANNSNKEHLKRFKLLEKRQQRLVSQIENGEGRNWDLTLTDSKEIALIYSMESLGTYLILIGSESDYFRKDCSICYSFMSVEPSIVKVTDFTSNTKRKGYGKALMLYFIQKMRKEGVVEVWGDLAHTDEDSFYWLIPFYESLGFTCTLFDDQTSGMRGKITMFL